MPQNLIWLVSGPTDLGAVIHPQGQPPRRTGGLSSIQPRKDGDRLKGGEAVASLAHMPADALGFHSMAVAPASSTVNTRTPSVPHMRLGAWVILTDMGIASHGGGIDGKRAWLFSRITRSTRLRETRMPRS